MRIEQAGGTRDIGRRIRIFRVLSAGEQTLIVDSILDKNKIENEI